MLWVSWQARIPIHQRDSRVSSLSEFAEFRQSSRTQPTRAQKTLSNPNGMMEGEQMESHQKGFLKLKCFSPLNILTSPLFEETLGAFLFLSFFNTFSFCSVSWGLGDFDGIWGENHFFKNFFSNGMTMNGMVMIMDILTVDAYFGMELWTLI
jgi:hypothetical protein